MTDANLDHLNPLLKPLAEQFLLLTNAQFTTKITITWRSSDDQDKAHVAGLSNALAGQSPHNCCTEFGLPSSRAFDFAILDERGHYVTDGTDPRYATAGRVAKSLGLKWGGDFTKPDYDHAELMNWRSVV